MDQEWQRLKGLYAGLSDGELLKLAASKDGLTDVAQQAVDAEMASRRLVLEADEEASGAELTEGGPESSPTGPPPVELITFQLASEAETALRLLDEHGIPVLIEPAMRQMEENGPKIKTNWLTFFVEMGDQPSAVRVLRKGMGLFPVLSPDEMDASPVDADEDERLFTVGEFDVETDAEAAQKALTEAGIWFKADKVSAEGFEGVVIEARLEDLERAVQVVGEAFAEEA